AASSPSCCRSPSSPSRPPIFLRGSPMTDVDQRAAALDEIAALARRHGFTADEIAAAMTRTPSREDKRRGVLVRVLGFLGGTFVFAGVAVFIALQWDSMNSA